MILEDPSSVAVLFAAQNSSYYTVVALVLLLYDWVISFPREVKTFWISNPRLVPVLLYFTNRVVSLSVAIAWLMPLSPLGSNFDFCTRVSLIGLALDCASYIPPAVFSAMRAYALTQRSVLSFVIFGLFLAAVVADAMRFTYTSSILDSNGGCFLLYHAPPTGLAVILFIACRACAALAILADVLLIIVTWRLLPYRPTWRHRSKLFYDRGLVCLLLRNGVVYFIVMILLNTMDLIFTTISVLSETTTTTPVSVLRTCLPLILISRFLLDLQETYQRKVIFLGSDYWPHASHSGGSLSLSSARFGPALGALGATIELADSVWDHPDGDDEGESAPAGCVATGRMHSVEIRSTHNGLPPKVSGGDGNLYKQRHQLTLHIGQEGGMETQT